MDRSGGFPEPEIRVYSTDVSEQRVVVDDHRPKLEYVGSAGKVRKSWFLGKEEEMERERESRSSHASSEAAEFLGFLKSKTDNILDFLLDGDVRSYFHRNKKWQKFHFLAHI